MRSLVIGCMTALAWLALPSAVQSRELKFVTIDVAPWASAQGPKREIVGVFPDFVAEIEKRTGHTIKMSLHPFARLDKDMESGEQDCTIIVWADSRAHNVVRGETISSHDMGVVLRKGLKVTKYEDLANLRISILRGAPIAPRFDADTSLIKEYDADYPTGLRKLAHNRADGVAGALSTIRWLAAKEGIADHLGDDLVLADVPLVLQCSRASKNLDVMDELNQALRGMRDDGTANRIGLHHYSH